MMTNVVIYDDYNNRISSDQNVIGTLTTNIGVQARRNGIKLIECANLGRGKNMESNFKVRKLTPKECWRLMGFSDEDFENAKYYSLEESRNLLKKYPNHKGKRKFSEEERIERISDSQLYKQAGNSIVVDVLYYIMRNLKDAMPYLFEDMEIGSFFSGIGAFEKALLVLETKDAMQSDNSVVNPDLKQVGYINGCNSVANRIYDTVLARTLMSEAGGGGAKTGWYKIDMSES